MELTIFISNIILSMRKYQKENDIKRECVTNAQYLYDIIKINSNSDVKTKAVYVFSHNEEDNTLVYLGGHIVVILNNNLVIEPSNDVFCLKNVSYFDNFKDFINIFDDKVLLKSKVNIKKLIDDHIVFTKLSDKINNGELIICDKIHYNKQADYIENLYKSYILR